MGSIGPDHEAAEFTPHLYPPFPEDAKQCVELETFSLKRLLDGDSAEQERLLQVSKTRGFFLLELSDTQAEGLPQDAEDIGKLSEEGFKRPLEEKSQNTMMKTAKPNSIFGYKKVGFAVTDNKGSRDKVEFFNVSKDDILETPKRIPTNTLPLFMEPPNRELIARFQTNAHRVGLDILSIVATQLGLPANIFEGKHRINEPSDDHVRMTRGTPRKDPNMPEIALPGHTDFGTITLLFNWLGGLQIWSEPSRGDFSFSFEDPDSTEGWLWVKPRANHVIVNFGDAAVRFTGGALCSARHRVMPAPGEQGLWPRYSVVYFVRPEDNAVLKRFEGGNLPKLKQGEEEEEELTAIQWIAKQTMKAKTGSNGPQKA